MSQGMEILMRKARNKSLDEEQQRIDLLVTVITVRTGNADEEKKKVDMLMRVKKEWKQEMEMLR